MELSLYPEKKKTGGRKKSKVVILSKKGKQLRELKDIKDLKLLESA